ncbi:MAG: hypothetical protein HY802_02990 [Methanobacterium sp.]|nr:hypothetical protein [Methanobacterium sp.]
MPIALLLLVAVALGSSSNNPPNHEYNVFNSTFQIGSSWWEFDESNSTNNSLMFNNHRSLGVFHYLTLRLTQYTNNSTFESEYQNSKKTSVNRKVLNTENTIVAGIQVNFINATDANSNKTIQEYYFQKNGKYFSIQILGSSDTVNEFNNNSIRFTLESIISTIK